MAYCCDSPTCASCCLKTVSVIVTLILMAICVERLVLDLLGYQWTGCIFDFTTLLSCLFAVAAVCQLRPGFCYVVGAWLLAWIGWNAFLICYYLDVSGLLDRAASVLHWGTGKTSYWYRLLSDCSDYRLQLRLPVALLGSGNATSSAWWCLVDYRTAELLHCIASGGVALLSLLLLACLACQLREELRKFDQPIMAATYLPVSADSSFAKARPGRRMTRRLGDQLEGTSAAAAASLSSAVADGQYADNSLGRRSAGSRRSSVMRDPLPWVELQVTAVPPPPHPPQSDESDDGDASEFFDDARPPPYSAASSLDGFDSRRRRQHHQQQQQPRRRHRSAGSSGRKRKQNRRRAAVAAAAQPVGGLAPTAAAIPRPSSAIGYHDNLAYSRDDDFDDPPPPPPPAPQPQPFVPQFGVNYGGGVVNRTFRLSSESVAAGATGPATPYASGAAPLFRLQQPLQNQRPPIDYNEDEFPPPPSPMLADLEPPPQPAAVAQTSLRPLQKPPLPQLPPPHGLLALQQPAQSRPPSQQHRPMRNSNQQQLQQQSMSRSRAPISPEAAFSGLDQLDSGSRLSLRSGPQQPMQSYQQQQQQQHRASSELKPIFVSTRNEAAAAGAAGPPSVQRHLTSPSPRASLPRQPSYVSATSPGLVGASSGVPSDSGDAGIFLGGVHGSSVLI